MKKILFLLFIILISSCREKLMIITTTKANVSAERIEPYDKKIYKNLKTCANVTLKIVRIKKIKYKKNK